MFATSKFVWFCLEKPRGYAERYDLAAVVVLLSIITCDSTFYRIPLALEFYADVRKIHARASERQLYESDPVVAPIMSTSASADCSILGSLAFVFTSTYK